MPGLAPAPWASFGPWADIALTLVGAALLVAGFRAWCGTEVSWRLVGGYLLIVTLVHGRPLASRELELPSDIEYRLPPWAEASSPPAAAANPLLTDVTEVLLPFRTLANRRLLAGELPLWSHELGVGQPLLANGQSAVFSPFHLLTLPLPPARALSVTTALALLLTLLAAHLLARELGASRAGATLAALALALSTFELAWRYYPLGLAAAHLPALALGLVRLAGSDRRAVAATAVVFASLLASGNPEPVGLAALPALAAAVVLARRKPAGQRARLAGRCLLAAGLGLALAAPAWLPLACALPESARAADLAAVPDLMSPPPISLGRVATLWQPLALGWPLDGSWAGAEQDNWNEVASGYAGLVALALALVAWLSPGLGLRWAGGAASLAVLIALRWPPLERYLLTIPGLGLLPWSRARYFWVLAVALSAGLAVTRLRLDESRSRRRVLGALVGASLAYGVTTWATGRVTKPLWVVAALAGAGVVALAIVVPRLRPRFAAYSAAAVGIELLALGAGTAPRVGPEMDFRPTPVVRELAARVAALAFPCRVSALEGRLVPYLPALYGLWDPRGYDALRPAAALTLLRARFGGSAEGQPFHLGRTADPDMLRRLGVRFLLTGPNPKLPAPWSRLAQYGDLAIWEDAGAFQIFHVPHRIVAAGSQESALALAAWTLVPTQATSVEDWTLTELPTDATVRAIRAVNNGFDLEVEAPSGGLLASSVAWSRGWNATAAGAAAEVVRVDGAFLGVRLAPGVRRVALRYAPRGWATSKYLLLGGLCGLTLTIVSARRR